jgi:hypothetical protein
MEALGILKTGSSIFMYFPLTPALSLGERGKFITPRGMAEAD